MKYIVLDLEFCKVKGCDWKRYPAKNEIIQIGAVKLNEGYEIIDSFNTFVHPQFGKIGKFVQNLTGIYNGKVKDAAVVKDALVEFINWVGEDDVQYVGWSNSDYYQIKKEYQAKCLEIENSEALLDMENWLDFQAEFKDRFALEYVPSLSSAFEMSNLSFEGNAHDGLCDAVNTAKLFAEARTNPHFKVELVRSYTDSESIGISLGNLFANFNVAVA